MMWCVWCGTWCDLVVDRTSRQSIYLDSLCLLTIALSLSLTSSYCGFVSEFIVAGGEDAIVADDGKVLGLERCL